MEVIRLPDEKAQVLVRHRLRLAVGAVGVIDLGWAVRDPADLLRMRPAYDSGDHLHPDDAGHQAMANAVNLAAF